MCCIAGRFSARRESCCASSADGDDGPETDGYVNDGRWARSPAEGSGGRREVHGLRSQLARGGGQVRKKCASQFVILPFVGKRRNFVERNRRTIAVAATGGRGGHPYRTTALASRHSSL